MWRKLCKALLRNHGAYLHSSFERLHLLFLSSLLNLPIIGDQS